MRTLRLMADYQCFPLWEASPGVIGNVDPAELPISGALCADLHAWAADFDAVLNMDDPARSAFPDAEAEARFRSQGEALGQRLRAELGEAYAVLIDVT